MEVGVDCVRSPFVVLATVTPLLLQWTFPL